MVMDRNQQKAMFARMGSRNTRDSSPQFVTLRIPFETKDPNVLVARDKKVKVPGIVSLGLDKPREGSIEIQGFKKNPDKFGSERPNFFTKEVRFSKDAVEDEIRLIRGKRIIARAP